MAIALVSLFVYIRY